MSFQIMIESNETLDIALEGDLDINSAAELKTRVLEAYAAHPSDVRFDFTALSYLDSTGLGSLISILHNVQAQDHRITIAHARPNVRKLFTITELDQDFIMEDADEDR